MELPKYCFVVDANVKQNLEIECGRKIRLWLFRDDPAYGLILVSGQHIGDRCTEFLAPSRSDPRHYLKINDPSLLFVEVWICPLKNHCTSQLDDLLITGVWSSHQDPEIVLNKIDTTYWELCLCHRPLLPD